MIQLSKNPMSSKKKKAIITQLSNYITVEDRYKTAKVSLCVLGGYRFLCVEFGDLKTTLASHHP